MSILEWISTAKQKEYAISIEKQLLLANVEIVSLQEELAHYKFMATHQEEVIHTLVNHMQSNEVAKSKDGKTNVILLKSKRKPRK